MSTLSLRLPDSLHETAKALAMKEHVSVNQLIATAVAEKVSALMTEDYLEARAKKGRRKEFERILAKVPDVEPDERDRF
jgi:predicted transcriptional regulator